MSFDVAGRPMTVLPSGTGILPVERVPVHRRLRGRQVRLDPLPRGIAHEQVAGQRGRGLQGLARRSRRGRSSGWHRRPRRTACARSPRNSAAWASPGATSPTRAPRRRSSPRAAARGSPRRPRRWPARSSGRGSRRGRARSAASSPRRRRRAVAGASSRAAPRESRPAWLDPNFVPCCSAVASGIAPSLRLKKAPLSPIALWKRPLVSGVATSAFTENDPADSPKIVTLPGSPPNAAMLSFTHFRDGDLVEQAVVAGRTRRRFLRQFGVREEPEHPEAVVDRDEDDALLRERLAVVARLGPAASLEAATVDPDHHGCLGGLGGGVDVDRQAVLAELGELDVVEDARLDARRTGLGRVAHAVPRLHRLRRLPAQLADRRRGIRHADEHVDRAIGDRRALHQTAGRLHLGRDVGRRPIPRSVP